MLLLIFFALFRHAMAFFAMPCRHARATICRRYFCCLLLRCRHDVAAEMPSFRRADVAYADADYAGYGLDCRTSFRDADAMPRAALRCISLSGHVRRRHADAAADYAMLIFDDCRRAHVFCWLRR